MSEEDAPKSIKVTQEEFDYNMNRIQLALSKHENIVKSWTAVSSRKVPRKTDAQLDAEDAILFRNQPPYLGVGAPIPAEYLVSDAESNNKALRQKLFTGKGLKGSKPRDEDEKAASSKRGLNAESSDEEGGRSSLGKAKKLKTKATPAPIEEGNDAIKSKVNKQDTDLEDDKAEKLRAEKEASVENNPLATPPTTPDKTTSQTKTKEPLEETEESGRSTDQTKVPQVQAQGQKEQEQKQEASRRKSMKPVDRAKQLKIQKKKQKRELKQKLLKDEKQKELIAKLAVDTPEWLDEELVDTEGTLENEAQDQVPDQIQV